MSAIAWPLVVMAIGVLLLTLPQGRDFVKEIGRRVSRVRGGVFELELTPAKSEKVKQTLHDTVQSFRKPIIQEFDRWANVEHVKELLERVHQEVIKDALREPDQGFETTIYVKDVLIKDLLYRLIDYYPGGDGRGKVYSIRFGIIGKAWRLKKSLHATVPPNPTKLIEEWGMTWEETIQRGRSAKTFVCVILKDRDKATEIGLLFLQSEAKEAFADDIVKRLEESNAVDALSIAVDKVTRKLAEVAQPPLTIFDE